MLYRQRVVATFETARPLVSSMPGTDVVDQVVRSRATIPPRLGAAPEVNMAGGTRTFEIHRRFPSSITCSGLPV